MTSFCIAFSCLKVGIHSWIRRCMVFYLYLHMQLHGNQSLQSLHMAKWVQLYIFLCNCVPWRCDNPCSHTLLNYYLRRNYLGQDIDCDSLRKKTCSALIVCVYLQKKSTLNWQNSIDNRDAFRQLEPHQTI